MIRLDESDWKVVDGVTYKYMFIDNNVIDGIEYTYSIVAYDMGVEPTYVTRYIPLGDGQFETVIDTNFSNPNEWANPEGYASIENSKGTTILDRNFSQVYPGIQPQENLSSVKVVPIHTLHVPSSKNQSFKDRYVLLIYLVNVRSKSLQFLANWYMSLNIMMNFLGMNGGI